MAQEQVYFCIGCGKTHPRNNFYKSYTHKNGVYPFCKDYIKKTVYRNDETINVEKFKDILRQADAPYMDSEFQGAVSEKRETIGAYFSRINMPQNREATWKNSDFGIVNNIESIDVDEKSFEAKKPTELNSEEVKFLEEKWGYGYSVDELFQFERKYKMLKNNYSEKTAMHTEALYNYIRYRVKEEISTAEGNVTDAKAWGALASKAATDAKINPSQLSKADLSDGLSTFSELSQAVEKEVDIIPILPRFKYRPNDALDFNIWCYVNYMRDLSGQPPCDYEDVYAFYDRRVADYIEQYGDSWGIFTDDTSKKNRENIKKFIKEDGDE